MFPRSPSATTAVVMILGIAVSLSVQANLASEISDELDNLETNVLSDEERQQAAEQIGKWIDSERLKLIGFQNSYWNAINSVDEWEAFRQRRIDKLQVSLGRSAYRPGREMAIETTGRLEGNGFVVEYILYESRPGLWVSANLYRPAAAGEAMPAILVSHSHHNPKAQGELQTMGITWARQGCVVLVPDHLGHGERRQHPFASNDDYPESFRRSRQDYYFRYNVNLHLRSVGQSLMGWLAHDLRCGIDVLETIDGVDPDKTILIGAVAGGGDPAGVTAAIDNRIEAVIPFNFGGPQPDYAIPENAEDTFYYFGVAYWEQTRCLPRGGRDGFAHWVIVASAAPRGLIYSHEFGWDRGRDPAWPRIEKVYSLYEASDRLGFATGKGTLKGRPPESSHCNNVGAYHRRGIYPLLEKWFDMPTPAEEAQPQFTADQLNAFTPEIVAKINPQPARSVAKHMAKETLELRAQHAATVGISKSQLRQDWSKELGELYPYAPAKLVSREATDTDALHVERIVLESPGAIRVPLLLIHASEPTTERRPVVVAFARRGKAELLKSRGDAIGQLVQAGAMVVLPDLRETGESRSGIDLSRGSRATTLSCRTEVLGHTMLGGRLQDLLGVLKYIRSRDDTSTIAVWGESLAPANPAERRASVPLGIDQTNEFGEPGAALLAMLAALYDRHVAAVVAGGGIDSFYSVLDSPFIYLPHDCIRSNPILGDVDDLAKAIEPCRVLRHSSINGLNRRVNDEPPPDVAAWLLEAIQ